MASCSVARTAIAAPTGPDGVVARPGIWAKIGLLVPMIKPPRSTHTGIGLGNRKCEVCTTRFDRKERGWIGMGGDYTEGERRVLAVGWP